MQDQHFQQQWSQGHVQFSQGLAEGLASLSSGFDRRVAEHGTWAALLTTMGLTLVASGALAASIALAVPMPACQPVGMDTPESRFALA